LKSPQILELSGIGRPDVLEKIDVPVQLALDGVGENIQEHMWVGVSYGTQVVVSSPLTKTDKTPQNSKMAYQTKRLTFCASRVLLKSISISCKLPALYLRNREDFDASQSSTLSQGVFTMGVSNLTFTPLDTLSDKTSSLHADIRADIESGIKAGSYPPGLTDQYKLQLERLARKGPGCEIIGFPGFLSFPS
jgi:hypothetical protein